MTATEGSLPTLLNSLTESLDSATAVLSDNAADMLPPVDGISLLDLKNDLLLSYLQNLAFLVLFKIRNTSDRDQESDTLYKNTVEKLTELRIYLERGIRPIEQRLKYTIDQYLSAAQNTQPSQPARTSSGHIRTGVDDDDDDDHSDSDAPDNDETNKKPTNIPAPASTSLTPHLTSLRTATNPSTNTTKPSSSSTSGLYKPPRLNPTVMPSTDPDARLARQPKKTHHLLNEFLTDELSSAPQAQPSIGSNTLAPTSRNGRGPTLLSAQDLARQRERTTYEESNFTRLPGESKKEKSARRKREAKLGGGRDVFGGEDWSGLGGLGERIGRSVEGGKGRRDGGVLGRREKRRATEDAPRGDGLGEGVGGGSFEKRRRVLEARAERKKGRR